MAGKNTARFRLYTSVEHAERAVDTLIAAGFANSSISVLTPDTSRTRDFAHHKDTKAPEGTAAGVTTGGVIGGTLGVLAGVGALAIPGVGPFIAAGPIMAGLAGLGIGGGGRGGCRGFGRHGNSRIRSEALRRPCKRWRDAVIRALRYLRPSLSCEGHAEII